jgi:hypothetical protein
MHRERTADARFSVSSQHASRQTRGLRSRCRYGPEILRSRRQRARPTGGMMRTGTRTFGGVTPGAPPVVVFSSRTTPAGGSVSTPGSGSAGTVGTAATEVAVAAELSGAVSTEGVSSATGGAASSGTEGAEAAASVCAPAFAAFGDSGGGAVGSGDAPRSGGARTIPVTSIAAPCCAGGGALDVSVVEGGSSGSPTIRAGAKNDAKKQAEPASHENTEAKEAVA